MSKTSDQQVGFRSESAVDLADFAFALSATAALLLIATALIYRFREPIREWLEKRGQGSSEDQSSSSKRPAKVSVIWRKRLSSRAQLHAVQSQEGLFIVGEARDGALSLLQVKPPEVNDQIAEDQGDE